MPIEHRTMKGFENVRGYDLRGEMCEKGSRCGEKIRVDTRSGDYLGRVRDLKKIKTKKIYFLL